MFDGFERRTCAERTLGGNLVVWWRDSFPGFTCINENLSHLCENLSHLENVRNSIGECVCVLSVSMPPSSEAGNDHVVSPVGRAVGGRASPFIAGGSGFFLLAAAGCQPFFLKAMTCLASSRMPIFSPGA